MPPPPLDPARRPDAPLAGRTVLVTGGAVRVGEAIGREAAARGARVIVHYRSSGEAAERLAGELGHGALALGADLAAADGAARLLAACDEAGARPDAVVHSAASFLHRPLAETTAADWDAVFALNLRAFFLLAQEFARRHGVGAGEAAPAGEGAAGEGAAGESPDLCLVALSDSGAYELWTGYAAHCVAKAALLPLVELLAKALAPAVRVNAVIPGPVLPPDDASPEELAAIARRTLAGRLGDPSDVARAVAFLLDSRYATGTLLEMTGGAHLWRGGRHR